MKNLTQSVRVGILGLFIALGGAGFSDPTQLSDRASFFKALDEDEQVKMSAFEFPFLVAQTGQKFSMPAQKLAQKVEDYLIQTRLPIRSHFETQGVGFKDLGPEHVPLDKMFRTGKQLLQIKECTVESCKVKLQNKKEKPQMNQATPETRLKTYQTLLAQRLQSFLGQNVLLGYEERLSNYSHLQKAFDVVGYLGQDYPEMKQFLLSFFGPKKHQTAATPSSSFIRKEVIHLDLKKMQPIYRLSEVLVFQKNDRKVFVEWHIYTNHFFDSSLRVYEVMPLGKYQSKLVATNIQEIDELTSSSFVRALYIGRMYEAVHQYQLGEFKKMGR